jgi:hypothetical protein
MTIVWAVRCKVMAANLSKFVYFIENCGLNVETEPLTDRDIGCVASRFVP